HFFKISSFFFQAEDGIRDFHVTGVQTCALPILAPLRRSAAIGYRVVLIRVDLPEPDTPVIQVNRPKGISSVTLFRLLPVAPTRRSILSGLGAVRCWGTAITRVPERYSPVSEPGVFMICSGVPWATTWPPWTPAPGPISIT